MSYISAFAPPSQDVGNNVMEVVESFAESRLWPLERFGPDEIVVSCPGQWGAYDLYFAQIRSQNRMQFACTLNLSFPQEKRAGIERLICLINNRLEMGHFGLEAQEKILSFRHTLFPSDTISFSHIDDLISLALRESENLYPAFQHLIWGNQTADKALENVLFETHGQA